MFEACYDFWYENRNTQYRIINQPKKSFAFDVLRKESFVSSSRDIDKYV